MSQIMRPTFSPLGPAQGNTRKVERSGLRYMSDSSIRTKPSMDEPSNMILPSSASSNWRSGISTFLIVPRMSVNWRRMNLTFSRSVRSRICAFVSRGAPVVVLTMASNSSQLFDPDLRLKPKGDVMKLVKLLGVLVAVAGVAFLTGMADPSVYGQSGQRAPADRSESRRPGRPARELTMLSGRGAEIGASIRDV